MKKIYIYSLIILLASCSSLNQQEKAIAKATQKAQNMALFEEAKEALKSFDFVMEGDRLDLRRGKVLYVAPLTNFISLKGDDATVQLSWNDMKAGANGVGGVTLDGKANGKEIKEEKNGDITIYMIVQGTGISAEVNIRLQKNSNKCIADVSPNFNNNNFRLTGYMYPTGNSRIFKGRPL